MMNEKDMKILAALRSNSRETLTTMSKNTDIPISTIFDRVRKYQESIITKFTSIIDFQTLGYNARAQVMLKAHKSNREKMIEFLSHHPHVNSIYKINNGYDVMIDVIFRTIREMEDFMELIDEQYKLKARMTYFIIDEIKQEEFLALAPDTIKPLADL